MALGKEELLAAIAAAGTAGRTAYEQAQAQIASQQQEAVRAALASAVTATPEGQAEISRIVGTGYAPRQAQLTSNLATMNDWYERQKAMQGTFLDNASRLGELQAAALASGRGGGGGGGGKEPEPPNWYDELKDQFGTADIGFDAIAAEADALGLTKYKNSGLSPFEATRRYAVEKYGVPEGVAATKYTQSKEDQKAQAWINENAALVRNAKQRRKFMRTIRSKNRQTPGDQTYLRKQAKTLVTNKKKK